MFSKLITALEGVIDVANTALYSYVLIIILIAAGLVFTVTTKLAQFRLLPAQIKAVSDRPGEKSGVSSFQALMVSTASRVGTGNIVGVATAICAGGFGSVFWMWIIAIVGGASAFIESTLAQIFKKRGPDGCYGGPAYYIEQGLRCRTLGIVFAIFLIVTYGFGFNMLASYNLQSTFSTYSFYNASVTPWVIGGILAVGVGYCIMGGGKRILKATGVLVPVMGCVYILVAFVITVLNITELPAVFVRIFTEAFDLKAIFGAFGGSCVMHGIKRGLYSNEAGVGSAPNASASAEVDHPVKQGLVQVLSVFIDTLLVCSATAFMCMTSGVDESSVSDGAVYVQTALSATLGAFGPIFITAAMILFAFTTLLGNLYYVEQCYFYIFKRKPGVIFNTVSRIVASLLILFGAVLSADLLWGIADVTMGLMTLINIPVICLLGKYAIRALKDYEKQTKEGKSPTFKATDIGLSDLDYWN